GEDVFRLAGHVPLAEAALGEPVACVVRSVKKAGVGPGDRVLVIGGGMMGLLLVQLLRGRAAAVVFSEPDPDRRAIALEMSGDGPPPTIRSILTPTAVPYSWRWSRTE